MYSSDGTHRTAPPSPQDHSFAGPSSSTGGFVAQPPPSPSSALLPVPASASTPPSPTRTRSDRPPRPMNAWLLFRTAQLRQMQEVNPGLRKSQGELSKIISEMWKTVSPELKQGYEDLARQRKAEHQRIYPDYRYSPSTKPKAAAKPKRSASTGSRATRPSLRLSPSQHAFRPASYEPSEAGGGADSMSTSASSSATGSPRYGALPTPSTATWSGGYEDYSPPGSAQPVYEHDEPVLSLYAPRQGQFVGLPRPAPPQSAPPTMAHFPPMSGSSALGLTLSHRHSQSYNTWDAHVPPPPQPASASRVSFANVSPPQTHTQGRYLSPPSSATHAPAPYPSSSSSSAAYPQRQQLAHRVSYGAPTAQHAWADAPEHLDAPPLSAPTQSHSHSHSHSNGQGHWRTASHPHVQAHDMYRPLPSPHAHQQQQHQQHSQPMSVSPAAVYGLPAPAPPPPQQWEHSAPAQLQWEDLPSSSSSSAGAVYTYPSAPAHAYEPLPPLPPHAHLRHRSASSGEWFEYGAHPPPPPPSR
ncbi:hypothetical protein JCM10450v2_006602 [Rhodotorula kratochvilovae]